MGKRRILVALAALIVVVGVAWFLLWDGAAPESAAPGPAPGSPVRVVGTDHVTPEPVNPPAVEPVAPTEVAAEPPIPEPETGIETASISGYVVQAVQTSRPRSMENVLVEARLPDALTLVSTRTDAGGMFRLEGLQPGLHHLRATLGPGGAPWDPKGEQPVEAPSKDVRIPLTLPEDIAIVELRLVDDLTGEPVWPARVKIQEFVDERPRGNFSYSHSKSPTEEAALKPFLTTEQRVGDLHRWRVSADGYESVDGHEVVVQSGERRREVLIRLRKDPRGQGVVHITVSTEAGAAPDRIMVYRVDGRSYSGNMHTLAEDRIRLILPPGTHRLVLGGSPDGHWHPSTGDFLPEPLEIEVLGAGEIERAVTLSRGGRIRMRGPEGAFDEHETPLVSGGRSWSVKWRLESGEEDVPHAWTSGPIPHGAWESTIAVAGKKRRLRANVVAGEIAEIALSDLEAIAD